MPTYEYRCKMCGWKKGINRPMVDRNHPVECELCGELAARVYGMPGTKIQGLNKDRFHYQDKVLKNRQAVEERGMPSE